MTTRAVIEKFFALSTQADPPATADCLAPSWRSQFDAQALKLWSEAGPATNLVIDQIDQVAGRDRFRVTVSLSNGTTVGWQPRDTRFFSVVIDQGSPRIIEIATALAAP